MKLMFVFALFILSIVVKGSLMAAAARPVILSLGTIFTAMKTHDALSDIQSIEWKNLIPFAEKETRTE